MIYDITLGFNELDVFLVRYHELKNIVDKFVIVEATHTHSGKPKPLYFTDWADGTNVPGGNTFGDIFDVDKIEIVLWDNGAEFAPLKNEYAWIRENAHREKIGDWVLHNCSKSDIIMVSDMDEIPSNSALERFLSEHNYLEDEDPVFNGIWHFEQDLTYLYFNAYAGKWCGTRIFYATELHGHMPVTNRIRYGREVAGIIQNGGWHFSSCGGKDKVRDKFDSYAHTEMQIKTDDDIADSLERVVNPFDKSALVLTGNDTLPRYVQDNINYFIEKGYIRL